ncbi:MAG: hypothetical protein ABI999_14465 [Acidobacteriota bacterium]
MSSRDASWEVDLIWKYLSETSTPGVKTGDWFSSMDPGGTLNDRHTVYDMLTSSAADTNPDMTQLRAAMIPWNQRHAGIIKAFKSELACGSVVKLSFMKYMGWGSGEQKSRSLDFKGWNGVLWVVKSLRAGQPVRCYLKAKNHYVGIVGCRGKKMHPDADDSDAAKEWEFLVMDPWAGGASTGSTTISYAGIQTKFLGIAKQVGLKIVYDSIDIYSVEGPFPW